VAKVGKKGLDTAVSAIKRVTYRRIGAGISGSGMEVGFGGVSNCCIIVVTGGFRTDGWLRVQSYRFS